MAGSSTCTSDSDARKSSSGTACSLSHSVLRAHRGCSPLTTTAQRRKGAVVNRSSGEDSASDSFRRGQGVPCNASRPSSTISSSSLYLHSHIVSWSDDFPPPLPHFELVLLSENLRLSVR